MPLLVYYAHSCSRVTHRHDRDALVGPRKSRGAGRSHRSPHIVRPHIKRPRFALPRTRRREAPRRATQHTPAKLAPYLSRRRPRRPPGEAIKRGGGSGSIGDRRFAAPERGERLLPAASFPPIWARFVLDSPVSARVLVGFLYYYFGSWCERPAWGSACSCRGSIWSG